MNLTQAIITIANFVGDSVAKTVARIDEIERKVEGLGGQSSGIDDKTLARIMRCVHAWEEKVDTDKDDLTDYDEYETHGTDPYKQDTDNDGVGDGTEIRLGFNPLDATNKPDIIKLGDFSIETNSGLLGITIKAIILDINGNRIDDYESADIKIYKSEDNVRWNYAWPNPWQEYVFPMNLKIKVVQGSNEVIKTYRMTYENKVHKVVEITG